MAITIQIGTFWWLDLLLLVGMIVIGRKKPLTIFLMVIGFIVIQASIQPSTSINQTIEWVYEIIGFSCLLLSGYLLSGEE